MKRILLSLLTLVSTAFAGEFRPPWRQLLSPFWAIAPVETGLFIDDPEIAATLQDAGLGFEDVAPEAFPALFPGGAPDVPLIAARPAAQHCSITPGSNTPKVAATTDPGTSPSGAARPVT